MEFLLLLGLAAPWVFGYWGRKLVRRSRDKESRVLAFFGILIILLGIVAFGAAVVILDNYKAIFAP